MFTDIHVFPYLKLEVCFLLHYQFILSDNYMPVVLLQLVMGFAML